MSRQRSSGLNHNLIFHNQSCWFWLVFRTRKEWMESAISLELQHTPVKINHKRRLWFDWVFCVGPMSHAWDYKCSIIIILIYILMIVYHILPSSCYDYLIICLYCSKCC
jgi:hypothetical protein